MTKNTNFTPDELLNIKFSAKEKGYDPLEVDQTFDKMIDDYKNFLERIRLLEKDNAKNAEEIKLLKDQLSKLQIEFAKLKQQYDSLPKFEGINQDNYKLMKKISAYERVLYKKGIDPKKALSDPDNC